MVAAKNSEWRLFGNAETIFLTSFAEAHVQHPVRLVKDEEPDVLEVYVAPAPSGPGAGPGGGDEGVYASG